MRFRREFRASRKAMAKQIKFMRRHLLEMADVIDELRIERDQLKYRGDRLIEALDKNDGTIESAWKIGNAVSAWQEYGGR